MKADNQWHDGIVYQHSDDDNFVIVDGMDDIKADVRPKAMVEGRVRIQRVRYNWNRGQPIVDFGKFQMSICDVATAPSLS